MSGRPLAAADLRLLAEVDAGHVTLLPRLGEVILAPNGHPRRRSLVTGPVGRLVVAGYVEIGHGVGPRIPLVPSALGRKVLSLVRKTA